MARETNYKGQLRISVVSFRRESLADMKFAKVVTCVCVFKYVVVCALVVCFTNYLFGEMNAIGPSCHFPLAAPKMKQISDTQGE